MTYLQITVTGESNVWFFQRKRKKELEDKNAEIEAIKLEIQRKAELAAREAEEVNNLMKNNPGGIAELLMYATGSARRRNRQ